MKTKRFRIVLAILIVAIVVGVGWWVVGQRDPVYKGERYSMWLDEYASSQGHSSGAEEAIRHIGTNGFPQLVKMLAAKDSRFEQFLLERVRKHTSILNRLPDAGSARYRAYWAFKALGPDAKSAVPGLVGLLDDKDSGVRSSALDALLSIGPSASNAVPAIIQQIKDKDISVRIKAVLTLGAIHSGPELTVPALTASLQDQIPRIYAVVGLGAFGADAKPAVPALVELLQDRTPVVRSAVTNALRKIDPEAAAKAGVK